MMTPEERLDEAYQRFALGQSIWAVMALAHFMIMADDWRRMPTASHMDAKRAALLAWREMLPERECARCKGRSRPLLDHRCKRNAKLHDAYEQKNGTQPRWVTAKHDRAHSEIAAKYRHHEYSGDPDNPRPAGVFNARPKIIAARWAKIPS